MEKVPSAETGGTYYHLLLVNTKTGQRKEVLIPETFIETTHKKLGSVQHTKIEVIFPEGYEEDWEIIDLQAPSKKM